MGKHILSTSTTHHWRSFNEHWCWHWRSLTICGPGPPSVGLIIVNSNIISSQQPQKLNRIHWDRIQNYGEGSVFRHMRSMADVIIFLSIVSRQLSPPIFNTVIVLAGRWMIVDMALNMYCLIQKQRSCQYMLYYTICVLYNGRVDLAKW